VIALLGAWIAFFGVLVYLFIAVQAGPTSPAAATPEPGRDEPGAGPAVDRDDTEPPVMPRNPLERPGEVGEMPAPPAPPTEVLTAPNTGDQQLDLELSTAMDEANRFYDRADYDGAHQAALKVLERAPGNVRMLRVIVSTACIMGEPEKAQTYWRQLPEHDRAQMTARCARYNVTFAE